MFDTSNNLTLCSSVRKKAETVQSTEQDSNMYKWKCNTCGNKFYSPTFLSDHISVVHEGKQISCDYITCNKTFTNTNAIKSHRRKHTDTPSKMCHICCKLFCHKSRLNQHLHSHEGSKQFECAKCDKKYLQKYELNRHTKT